MADVLTDLRDDGVAVLTLHDPDRLNAMTDAMGEAIAGACEQLRTAAGLRAVVVTGTPPAFSAGGDLAMLEGLAARARDEGFDAAPTMRSFYDRFLAVRELPVPVVAAVNGHAVGAGLCVALACDLRLVAADAKVGLNFARLGLHPGMGGSWLLPRVLGPQRAAAWLYTGELVTGAEAAGQGLALTSHPADEVLPAALELAGRIAAASPAVVRRLRENLRGVELRGLEEQLDREAEAQAHDYAGDDLPEGIAAVRGRRAPRFGDPTP